MQADQESNSSKEDGMPYTRSALSVEEQMDVSMDEGWVAWSQVLVSALLCFNGFGYFSSFGLFESEWTVALGQSAANIAWTGSFQLCLLFFIGTLSGRLMDAGYFKSLIYSGCTLQVLGIFTTSAVKQYWQLVLTQGVLQGLGNGLLFTPCVALVSTYFEKKRSFALGLTASGTPIGGLIFTTIARQLISRIGLSWTIRVMGFVVVFNSTIIILLARPRKSARIRGPFVEWSAFKETPYILFTTGIFIALWGVYIAYFYVTTFGRTVIGLDSSQSLNLLMVLNAVGVLGRLIPGIVADRYFGPLNTLIPCILTCGVLFFCWLAISNLGGYYAFVVLYGFCSNAVQTLFPATLSSLTTDLTKMGTRVGMCFSVISIACLAGPPTAGALMQQDGGRYRFAQVFGGITIVVGGLFVVAARVAQKRQGRAQ